VPELTNRQIVLRRRPTGLVQPGDTELVSTRAPEPADGEALVRATYVGIDAAVRTWLNDQPGYLPPVQLGEVIRAAGSAKWSRRAATLTRSGTWSPR
jgi:NADPH-dependent curcumin reductase CurA